MASLDELVAYCNARTRLTAYTDAPGARNGLQVANNGTVTKIGAAVDQGLIPFQKAAAAGIDFLIVHHGMYWDMPQLLTGPIYQRVKTLFDSNCALYSNHLPLDGHPEIGNNALLAKQLGLSKVKPWDTRPHGAKPALIYKPCSKPTTNASSRSPADPKTLNASRSAAAAETAR